MKGKEQRDKMFKRGNCIDNFYETLPNVAKTLNRENIAGQISVIDHLEKRVMKLFGLEKQLGNKISYLQTHHFTLQEKNNDLLNFCFLFKRE